MLAYELLMWTEESAADTLWRACRSTEMGDFDEAMRVFELLLKPAPDACKFFAGFQYSYVRLGAKRLAEVHPAAQTLVDDWERENQDLIELVEKSRR
jgi:hypothetical protein